MSLIRLILFYYHKTNLPLFNQHLQPLTSKPRKKAPASIRFLPASCNDNISILPSPQPIHILFLSAVTAPGTALTPVSGSPVSNIFAVCTLPTWSVISVQAAGYGDNPRTWLYIFSPHQFQSILQVSLNIFGAGVGSSFLVSSLSCGIACTVPAMIASTVSITMPAPIFISPSYTVSTLSCRPTGIFCC